MEVDQYILDHVVQAVHRGKQGPAQQAEDGLASPGTAWTKRYGLLRQGELHPGGHRRVGLHIDLLDVGEGGDGAVRPVPVAPFHPRRQPHRDDVFSVVPVSQHTGLSVPVVQCVRPRRHRQHRVRVLVVHRHCQPPGSDHRRATHEPGSLPVWRASPARPTRQSYDSGALSSTGPRIRGLGLAGRVCPMMNGGTGVILCSFNPSTLSWQLRCWLFATLPL